ncbi:LpqB family beta-propeller domain-containing protein [Sphaerimonospora cavernae]|uniref:LpqB family beta-propeller domain-containing protein n=1 Tax=Sphaerimonospora cavernae TaxID=1740611 RepID=A0ABV6U2X6_9ACTN
MSPRFPRTTATAAAFAILAAGTGCATVPTSGSPHLVDEDRARDTLSQQYVRLIAEPPKKDASPEDVVKGFQAATASFDDPRLTMARRYLTADASQKWKPWKQTRVYDEGKFSGPIRSLKDAKDATVTLKGTAVATIGSEGNYTPATGMVEETFRLVRGDDKQWRIAQLPDGRLLSRHDLERAYRRVDLCFPPATPVNGLVVDRVWVPIIPGRGLPETRVRRLLAGPSESIRGAVATAFPGGTELNRITVEGGDTLVVDFTSAVESVSDNEIDAMKAQLVWSLGELATGFTVEIRVNGEPFRGIGLRFKLPDYAQFDPNVVTAQAQVYFMRDGKLHRVKDKGGGDPVLGAAGEQDVQFTAPAVSGDYQPRIAALVNGDGVYVTGTAQGGKWQRWIAGRDLTGPSWDRYGSVWAAEPVGEGKTRVWQATQGQARRVGIPPALANGRMNAFRVSRDGTRVAVIMDEGRGTTVKIGTIFRIGRQVRIDNVRTLVEAQDRQKIKAIAWRDAADLLVLSKGKGGQDLATWSVMEGKPAEEPAIKLDAQAEIVSIAGAPDHVLAGTDIDRGESGPGHGEVRTYSGDKREWTMLAKDGAADPVYPLG